MEIKQNGVGAQSEPGDDPWTLQKGTVRPAGLTHCKSLFEVAAAGGGFDQTADSRVPLLFPTGTVNVQSVRSTRKRRIINSLFYQFCPYARIR